MNQLERRIENLTDRLEHTLAEARRLGNTLEKLIKIQIEAEQEKRINQQFTKHYKDLRNT